MKHAPSLESNTTCCKLGRECRTCPYPSAVAAFPVRSFLYVIQCTVFSAPAIRVCQNQLSS